MQFLKINDQHWINTAYIDDVYVTGTENTCSLEIHLNNRELNDTVTYRRFNTNESCRENAFDKAQRALQELIDHLTEENVQTRLNVRVRT